YNTIPSKSRVRQSSTPPLASHEKRFKLCLIENGIWIACHKPNASPVHETNNGDIFLAEIDETDEAEWHDDELVQDEIANTKSNVFKRKLIRREVKPKSQKCFNIRSLFCVVDGCESTFATKNLLDHHLIKDHGIQKYRCNVSSCGQSFKDA